MSETERTFLTGAVLVAEDDSDQRAFIVQALAAEGHDVLEAADTGGALRVLQAQRVDAVVCDLKMPGAGGLAVLRAAAARTPPTPVAIVTAYATVDSAIEAMKLGAVDYVVKPADPRDLQTVVHQALERGRMLSGAGVGDEETSTTGLLGASAAIARVHDQIRRAAPYECTVLINGESGTGKELVARAVHALGPTSAGPFVDVNCAALPADLMESQLFGHERGAFTGAAQQRRGLFEQAIGGTLFLDEFVELTPEAQAKLLRALEERQIRRLGGTEAIPVNVRVLAATNIDLQLAVREGRLREDLYYRLNVLNIELPPLRERSEDVPLLLRVFLDRFATANEQVPKEVTPAALQVLQAYAWPGNVRQLKNAMERLAITVSGDTIDQDDVVACLPETVGGSGASPATADSADEAAPVSVPEMVAQGMTLEQIERRAIGAALERTGGNRTQAARILGISVRTLHRRLSTLGI